MAWRLEHKLSVFIHDDGQNLWTLTHTRDFAVGFAGLVGNPKAFGEALYGQQKPYGIHVTTICPGFIETPLTDKNKFYMPFLMQAPQAAHFIRTRLTHAPALIAFPLIMRLGAWIGACLPSWIALPLFALFPKKEK